MYTFAVGTAVAGAAAVLMAPITLLYPDIGFVLFIKSFAAAVLGGLTSIPGAVAGGFLIGLIETLTGGYISTSLQDVSSYIVIMFALVFMPSGLFGGPVLRKV
jgi:branched-chain amino acid transport system permease protein